MVNLTRIISQDDIDSLNPGESVEFFPDINPDTFGKSLHAIVGEREEYDCVPFYRLGKDGDIWEYGVLRHHLIPGPFGTLDIQPGVTVAGPILIAEDERPDLYQDVIAQMSSRGFFDNE